jgi:hypothetical protein
MPVWVMTLSLMASAAAWNPCARRRNAKPRDPLPDALKPLHGNDPTSAMGFLRGDLNPSRRPAFPATPCRAAVLGP